MMQRDAASALLGMVVEHDEPGRAVVSMRVREDMLNGFAITHGGLVLALADTAFAIACNEDEKVTVAAGADITFLKSTHAGQCEHCPLAILRIRDRLASWVAPLNFSAGSARRAG